MNNSDTLEENGNLPRFNIEGAQYKDNPSIQRIISQFNRAIEEVNNTEDIDKIQEIQRNITTALNKAAEEEHDERVENAEYTDIGSVGTGREKVAKFHRTTSLINSPQIHTQKGFDNFGLYFEDLKMVEYDDIHSMLSSPDNKKRSGALAKWQKNMQSFNQFILTQKAERDHKKTFETVFNFKASKGDIDNLFRNIQSFKPHRCSHDFVRSLGNIVEGNDRQASIHLLNKELYSSIPNDRERAIFLAYLSWVYATSRALHNRVSHSKLTRIFAAVGGISGVIAVGLAVGLGVHIANQSIANVTPDITPDISTVNAATQVDATSAAPTDVTHVATNPTVDGPSDVSISPGDNITQVDISTPDLSPDVDITNLGDISNVGVDNVSDVGVDSVASGGDAGMIILAILLAIALLIALIFITRAIVKAYKSKQEAINTIDFDKFITPQNEFSVYTVLTNALKNYRDNLRKKTQEAVTMSSKESEQIESDGTSRTDAGRRVVSTPLSSIATLHKPSTSPANTALRRHSAPDRFTTGAAQYNDQLNNTTYSSFYLNKQIHALHKEIYDIFSDNSLDVAQYAPLVDQMKAQNSQYQLKLNACKEDGIKTLLQNTLHSNAGMLAAIEQKMKEAKAPTQANKEVDTEVESKEGNQVESKEGNQVESKEGNQVESKEGNQVESKEGNQVESEHATHLTGTQELDPHNGEIEKEKEITAQESKAEENKALVDKPKEVIKPEQSNADGELERQSNVDEEDLEKKQKKEIEIALKHLKKQTKELANSFNTNKPNTQRDIDDLLVYNEHIRKLVRELPQELQKELNERLDTNMIILNAIDEELKAIEFPLEEELENKAAELEDLEDTHPASQLVATQALGEAITNIAKQLHNLKKQTKELANSFNTNKPNTQRDIDDLLVYNEHIRKLVSELPQELQKEFLQRLTINAQQLDDLYTICRKPTEIEQKFEEESAEEVRKEEVLANNDKAQEKLEEQRNADKAIQEEARVSLLSLPRPPSAKHDPNSMQNGLMNVPGKAQLKSTPSAISQMAGKNTAIANISTHAPRAALRQQPVKRRFLLNETVTKIKTLTTEGGHFQTDDERLRILDAVKRIQSSSTTIADATPDNIRALALLIRIGSFTETQLLTLNNKDVISSYPLQSKYFFLATALEQTGIITEHVKSEVLKEISSPKSKAQAIELRDVTGAYNANINNPQRMTDEQKKFWPKSFNTQMENAVRTCIKREGRPRRPSVV